MGELKNKIKGAGLDLGSVADRIGMSRQNLSYHLKKPIPDIKFKEKLKEHYPDIFRNESAYTPVENNQTLVYMQHIIEEKDNTIESLKGQIKLLNERIVELTERLNRPDTSKHQRAG